MLGGDPLESCVSGAAFRRLMGDVRRAALGVDLIDVRVAVIRARASFWCYAARTRSRDMPRVG
jgi:hypothetical protein